MRKSLYFLAAALLMLAGCQKTTDTGTNSGAMDATAAAGADTTAPVTEADHANGSANTSTTPDTLPSVTGAATSSSTAADSDFIMKAAMGGMMEVELGKLAQASGSDPAVREIGGMMVKDHAQANDELKAIVTRKDVKLPVTLSPDAQAKRDQLAKLKGKEFDRMYIDEMVRAHQKDIAEFEKEAGSGQDPDVKAFAAKTLPKLKMHAEMVAKHQKKMMM